MSQKQNLRVGLFVTCIVDVVRPQVGFATLKLLEDAGCEVEVPLNQTCCGQPGFNSGAREASADMAKQFIEQFEKFDYIVVPSGSCAGMVKENYAELLNGDGEWYGRALKVANKTWELTSFLTTICQFKPENVSLHTKATYHDSCAGLRELGIKQQPRALLSHIDGLDLVKLEGDEVCCGFGGTFCVKYSSISNAIVTEKADHVRETEAEMLLGGEVSCLMNISGKMSREGKRIKAMHIAEVLAGMGDKPGIGEDN